MVPAVKAELARAYDVLGYETYVRMAGPFATIKCCTAIDNVKVLARAACL